MDLPRSQSLSSSDLRRRVLHEMGVLCNLAMEILWLVPWFRSLTRLTGDLTSARVMALFMGLALAAMLSARAANALGLRRGVRQLLLLLLLIGGMLLAIRWVVFRGVPVGLGRLILGSLQSFAAVLTVLPTELIVIFAVLFVWRRGIVASTAYVLDPGWTAHRFRLGVLAHVVFALVHRVEQIELMLQTLPAYFAAGLTAIALSRVDSLGRARGAGRTPFTEAWLAATLGLTGVTVGLGLGIGHFLQTDTAQDLAQEGGELMLRAAEWVLLLFRPLVYVAVSAGEWLISLVKQNVPVESFLRTLRENLPQLPVRPPLEEATGLMPWLEAYGPTLRILGTSIVITILALMAIRGARRLRRPPPEPPEDVAESLRARRLSLPSLRSALGRLPVGWRRGRRLGLARRLLAATAIRHIYAQLLELAEARGRRRDPSETPFEFLVHLRRLFPYHAGEVEVITEAYVRVRYGELPEDEEAVGRVRQSWESVRRWQALGSGAVRG